MEPNFECAYCKKPLYRRPSLVKLNKSGKFYCDKICRGKGQTILREFECTECGKMFTRKGSEVHRDSKNYFCTDVCSNRYYNRLRDLKIDYKCDYCGKRFKIQKSQKKNNKNTYCSVECKDKHHSILISGENAPRWNPNLTDEERLIKRKTPEYSEWRRKVFERDEYKCIKCRGRGSSLNAHHILNHSEHTDLRLDINNGVTLCYECHKEFHKKFGWNHNNEKQLKEFIENS